MWKKVKDILIIIGSSVAVFGLTLAYFLISGRNPDRRRSRESDERDTAIQNGITDCEGRAERVEERIERAEDAVGRCEEHLQRAEDILRRAVERSRQGKESS